MNAVNKDKKTALMVACAREDNLAVVDALVKAKADVNAANKDQHS